jgi:hypothetical protein
MALSSSAAENDGPHRYAFTITSVEGQVLGTGKIQLPFKLGANGNGTADWEFTATQAVSTNQFWSKAKAQLARGRGKANAECKESRLTLDFNPGWRDNNVTVSWPLKDQEAGDLYFEDFAGGHRCALFRIARDAQGAASNAAPPRR